MTIDRNKDLEIEYDHLNLPIRFGWNNNGNGNFDKEIRILYDAAGVKLRKTVIDSTIIIAVKDYVGGIEYTNGDLEAVHHADGRCVPRTDYAQYTQNGSHTTTTGAFVYEYTIRDHLGNARLTFADLDKDGKINVDHNDASSTEIIQENHYYPFGMAHEQQSTQVGTPNDYGYNGKELNQDFDLNLHDYGARWYDASIGRWHSIDPLAEKYLSYSPYNYVAGNPLKYIDIEGKTIGNPESKSAKRVKKTLSKTEGGKRLWAAMESSPSKIYMHVIDFAAEKTNEGSADYNVSRYMVESGAAGSVMKDAVFQKIKSGNYDEITDGDFYENMTWNSATGEYEDSNPAETVTHLIIETGTMEIFAEQDGVALEEFELETTAEEAAHTLQDFHDPGKFLKVQNPLTGEWLPIPSKYIPVIFGGMDGAAKYDENYENNRNEIEAKKTASDAVKK